MNSNGVTCDDDDDDDDISLISTGASEPQDEYEVETILAQKDFSTGKAYLVKWADYPLERATWEPEDSFCDPRTLTEWRQKICCGEHESFDVDALARRIKEIEEAKIDRHRRRRAKRIRLGIPVSPSTVSSGPDSDHSGSDLDGFIVGDNVDVDEEDEDDGWKALRKKRNRVSSNTKHTGSEAVPPSRSRNSPAKPCAKDQTSESLPPPSTKAPSKKSNSDVRPATRPAAANHSSLESPAVKKPKPSNTLQKASSQSKTREILKLQTSESTDPPHYPLPPPAQDKSEVPAKSDARNINSQLPRLSISTRPLSEIAFIPAKMKESSKLKLFHNLPIKNRYEKVMHRDLTPNIRQLDLGTPGEWTPSQKPKGPAPDSPFQTGKYRNMGSLFVDQDISHQDSNDCHRLQNSATTVDGLVEGKAMNLPHSTYPASDQPSPRLSRDSLPDSYTSAANIDSHAFSPNQESIKPSIKAAKKGIRANGRFFHSTEALVRLRFGPECKEIGDVRIGGLTKTTIWQLVLLKSKQKIDIHFKDVCNIDEYRQLCDRRQNLMFCSGWVLGFDDTSPAVDEMANYLRDNRLAALWYHPDENISSAMVAFALDSPEWSFLNQTSNHPSAKLRIAVRSSLAPMNSIQRTHALKATSDVNERNTGYEDSPMIMDSDPTKEMGTRDILIPPSIPLSVLKGPTDIKSIFRERFGITYDELSIVNTSHKKRTARSFYLHFPDEVEDEFQLLLHFLKQHDMVVFSNRIEGDWEKFVKTATTGTVLFHKKFIHYDSMSEFSKLLRNPINVFNISLTEPIRNPHGSSHLERLFPHGGIILITEDFILKHPKIFLDILRWFGHFIEKKFPGTWKMFLRPKVQVWLLDLCKSWPDDRIWQIYYRINSLIPKYPEGHYNTYRREGSPDSLDGLTDDEGQHHPFISTREIPDYGSRREDDHPGIPRGLAQAERDTDHLVEYFAGHALIHAEKFRRFIVLTTHKPQPRWRAWTHLEIMEYQEFSKSFMSSHMPSCSKTRKSSSDSRSEHHSTFGSGQGGDRDAASRKYSTQSQRTVLQSPASPHRDPRRHKSPVVPPP
ncbi:uncharacterized protein PADG_08400 [Paracoccidioides brasiliensis Pb18]|uniref:Chromo domain-containing protein n=1 Tax=Paracoccidioides brasiliensis (strain Pb18) TaxID=502780 RepID=C1GM09_PARBD|nr:uncharacterized protein PADG_08400 [Paracoccidioides brasiliensis Pb18]EEH43475.2 hypothetical protein PADG_08400 [Paracoccidioides brasiliensis Pb18]